ncbi:MAG: hypothetical protein IKN60_04335 [Bacteroidales bacterium]|nr:hypothetical protein [Bacteroidales bacterium]MBR6875711.1 hypothetical protein [Bacteroidales bacterium]
MNKTFLLIWIILQFALLLVGWGWVFVDRKNVKRKKAPYILLILGAVMLAIFMFFFVPKI